MMLSASISVAQNNLPVGKSQLNAGVGLSGWGIPIYVGLDHGVHSDITLGAEVSYRSFNERWRNDVYNHSVMGFLANGNYHFNNLFELSREWDVYAGLNIGFYSWSSPRNYGGNFNSGLGLGAQVGARYYLSKTFGLNLEVGGGNTIAGGKFGITVKL